ncbi:hypothetical protein [Paracraurococcus lichenis]|uniref:Uncharacterized protein n=1 Tax=Paracraurococcus lichenis TaxID=3064888 RepID=A0ABT9E0R1_9PROT|nr:hypothetical protein [Paracraurococcus sp. LOR1-02]MDO9709707.1 hypothetical protein [Paracraurococcus sp. LOR1-02]
MTRVVLALWCITACLTPAVAAEQRLPWQAIPGIVGNALHAFRKTDHWAARAMAENLDGSRLGRDNDGSFPLNFDPTRHLFYIVQDLNGNRRPEVFLLFD